jgi:hypothetical protein
MGHASLIAPGTVTRLPRLSTLPSDPCIASP